MSKSDKRQLVFTYILFAFNGVLVLAVGQLMPFIRDAKGLDYVFAGMLVSLHSVGNIVSSFTSGILPVYIGKKRSLLIFAACYCLSFALIIICNNKIGLAVAFLMTGLARGVTTNFCNDNVNRISRANAAYLNILHAMFSIGAFICPIVIAALTATKAQNWRMICVGLCVVGIVSFLIYALMPMENTVKSRSQGSEKSLGFFKEPVFYICTLTLFFYLCAEQGVIGWLATYFTDTGLLSTSVSQLMSSAMWVMMLVGRLICAWVSRRVPKAKIMLVLAILAMGFFIFLLFAKSTPAIVVGICGFGLSMSGIYPMTVSYSNTTILKYPLSWSFILTIASLGSVLMPSVIGIVAKGFGIAAGLGTIALVVVVMVACVVVAGVYGGRHDQVPSNHRG